jgi:hypothetical protein
MSRSAVSLSLAALFLVAAVTMGAQDLPRPHVIQLNNGEGILAAMKRGGCSPSQLVRVMDDNHIAVSQLRFLPPMELTLFDGCSGEADKKTTTQSAQLLHGEAMQVQLVTQNIALKKDNGELRTINTGMAETIKALKHDLEVLQEKFKETVVFPSIPPMQKFLYGVAGAGCIIVLYLLYLIVFRADSVTEEKVISRWHLGERHSFNISEMWIQCPISRCRELVQVKNFVSHCDGAHLELRMFKEWGPLWKSTWNLIAAYVWQKMMFRESGSNKD